MFDTLRFLKERHIDHTTSGNKHCRDGWVQVHCPFCSGSQGYHLGIKLDGNGASCWRCRGKSLVKVIQALTKSTMEESRRLYYQYQTGGSIKTPDTKVVVSVRKECKLPPGTGIMSKRHMEYLDWRGFDPGLLEEVYGLKGVEFTPPYQWRIIAPILFKGKCVSFQGRDITNKAPLKYKACPMDMEAVHHKHVLYGWDLIEGDSCLVVEGIADVWRMGPGCLGTFGTGYTPMQERLMAERFKTVHIAFDPEPIAQRTAEELAWSLELLGVETKLWDVDGSDPGDMKQCEADAFMRQLDLTGWNR